jgi:hypothetical protein
MDDDRGAKLAFYKTVRTLRHVVLVYPDQPRVEHYRNGEEGWTVEALTRPGDTLSLDALGVDVPLATIYAEITFDVPSREDRAP